MRSATIRRKTRETNIELKLDLDGKGDFDINTGIGFFNHMLETFSRHSLIDVTLNASGDINVDFHHLVEDTAICLGKAVMEALGDKKGICRFGEASVPLDEALCKCVIDISGRPGCFTNLPDYKGLIGEFDFELGEVFFTGFAAQGFTLHLDVQAGSNLHHIMEAAFKSFARAVRRAVSGDPRTEGILPSTKDYIDG